MLVRLPVELRQRFPHHVELRLAVTLEHLRITLCTVAGLSRPRSCSPDLVYNRLPLFNLVIRYDSISSTVMSYSLYLPNRDLRNFSAPRLCRWVFSFRKGD